MTIDDAPRLREHTQRAPSFGCDAKLVIHPLQVAGVHEAMAPCAEALDWVQRVIAADAPVPPCNWTAAWSMRRGAARSQSAAAVNDGAGPRHEVAVLASGYQRCGSRR